MVNIVHSATQIRGHIANNNHFFAYYLPASFKNIPFEFPRKHYGIRNLIIFDIDYDRDVPIKERKIDLVKFGSITLEGNLDLVSYDKKEQFCTFKLSLTSHVLNMRYFTPSYKPGEKIRGIVKFANNKDSCLIHGRYLSGEKPKFINMPSPDDCKFRIDEIVKYDEIINMRATENIPMIFELTPS